MYYVRNVKPQVDRLEASLIRSKLSAERAAQLRPVLARFAELHRSLKAAALEARRASCCFESHVQRCIFFEASEINH